MKILFVIDTFYTSNNGTSISAQRYAAELRKRGHQVRILCGDKPKSMQAPQAQSDDFCTGIFHFPIFQPLCEKNDFFYANADKKIIQQACNWADIVHIYTSFFLSNATLSYCKQINKPVTAAFHVQPENITSSFGLGKVKMLNNMIYRIFRHFTYSRVQHIHTPSNFIANQLREHGYKAQMHVISNGIHDEFIQAGSNKFNTVSATTSENNIFKVMMIGRLSNEKRQDVIINALQYSKYKDRIQLVFAGRGPLKEHYLKLSKNLPIQPQFVYLNREQLISELLTTDLYIHASDMEIEAISCIEAFATGLVPVIANSSQSATPQFALDERSLFQPGDPKDLARVIDYWLDRPEERHLMEKKYASSAHKYTLTNAVRRFESMLYAELNNEIPATISTRTPLFTSIKRQAIRLYKHIA